jgi:hypothetical protein
MLANMQSLSLPHRKEKYQEKGKRVAIVAVRDGKGMGVEKIKTSAKKLI